MKSETIINKQRHINIMKGGTLVFLLLGIFLISSVSAESIGSYKQAQEMQITNYCSIGSCTYMNLTSLELPNGTIIYYNAAMTQNQQSFNYSYTPIELGTYTFGTCGDPEGILVCDSDTFEVTPSGRNGSDNIALVIILIIIIYAVTLTSFFGKNIPLSVLTGMMMSFFGVWIIRNGIVIYRDNLTNYFGYITIAIGAIVAIWAIVEWAMEELF